MSTEKLTAISLDENQNITAIYFLNQQGETFGRKTTKESPIAISADSRLESLLDKLYVEYVDGYETSHADALVSSVKIKWEGENPIKCDLSIMANSTRFGAYSVPLPSPSTIHVTSFADLIQSISTAALKEYVDYDQITPAYIQQSLFPEARSLPNLSLVEAA